MKQFKMCLNVENAFFVVRECLTLLGNLNVLNKLCELCPKALTLSKVCIEPAW